MLEIKPKSFMNKGIGIYQPPPFSSGQSFVNLEIFYSKKDPRYQWIHCDNNLVTVFKSNQYIESNGNLFLFDSDLEVGFYTIKVLAVQLGFSEIKGDLVVGIKKEPTEPILIGLPYSIYPPITLI